VIADAAIYHTLFNSFFSALMILHAQAVCRALGVAYAKLPRSSPLRSRRQTRSEAPDDWLIHGI